MRWPLERFPNCLAFYRIRTVRDIHLLRFKLCRSTAAFERDHCSSRNGRPQPIFDILVHGKWMESRSSDRLAIDKECVAHTHSAYNAPATVLFTRQAADARSATHNPLPYRTCQIQVNSRSCVLCASHTHRSLQFYYCIFKLVTHTTAGLCYRLNSFLQSVDQS